MGGFPITQESSAAPEADGPRVSSRGEVHHESGAPQNDGSCTGVQPLRAHHRSTTSIIVPMVSGAAVVGDYTPFASTYIRLCAMPCRVRKVSDDWTTTSRTHHDRAEAANGDETRATPRYATQRSTGG